MKKKCEHLAADGWHVPTQEARELVRLESGVRYGWRDQLRAELSGRVSKWMWPAFAALLAFGLVIRDWWLILGSAGAIAFFLYQGATLVRTLGSGKVITTTSREISKIEADGKEPTWRAVAKIDGRRRDVDVTCQQCIDALSAGKQLDLAVLVDPSNPDNSWLAGFRAR